MCESKTHLHPTAFPRIPERGKMPRSSWHSSFTASKSFLLGSPSPPQVWAELKERQQNGVYRNHGYRQESSRLTTGTGHLSRPCAASAVRECVSVLTAVAMAWQVHATCASSCGESHGIAISKGRRLVLWSLCCHWTKPSPSPTPFDIAPLVLTKLGTPVAKMLQFFRQNTEGTNTPQAALSFQRCNHLVNKKLLLELHSLMSNMQLYTKPEW